MAIKFHTKKVEEIISSVTLKPEEKSKLLSKMKHGFACTKLEEPENKFLFNKALGETVLGSEENNTYIVFGRDRPGDIFSGFGGNGAMKCGSIDIVAGRFSAEDATTVSGSIESNFFADAARIYVAQRSDIDEYLRINTESTTYGKSAIAIKADEVRVVARSEIKFVCSNETFYSDGELIKVNGGVSMMSTNQAKNLQPIPLGTNLRDSLIDIVEQIRLIASTFSEYISIQKKFNEEISKHTHYSAFYSKKDSKSFKIQKVYRDLSFQTYLKVEENINKFISNLESLSVDYFVGGGARFINSAYHKVD